MAITLGFFSDAALTVPVTTLTFVHAIDDSLPFVKQRLYLGSPDATKYFQAASDPGVDDIEVSLTDPDGGDGFLTTHVKIAASSLLLDTATPGAAYVVGTQIDGGAGNGEEVWFQVIDTNLVSGTYPMTPTTNLVAQFTV
jgi:hypothetical protein